MSATTTLLEQTRAASHQADTLAKFAQQAFDRHAQLVQHRARCLALAKNPWCHNKQMMIAMADEAELDMDYEAMLVKRYARQLAELAAQQRQVHPGTATHIPNRPMGYPYDPPILGECLSVLHGHGVQRPAGQPACAACGATLAAAHPLTGAQAAPVAMHQPCGGHP